MKTCEECFNKCKAQCCIWVPMPINFMKKYEDKIQRIPIALYPANSDKTVVYPIIEYEGRNINGDPVVNRSKQYCVFLDENFRCAIYDNRLEICKLYGTTTEDDNSLTCGFHLGKDYAFPKEDHPDFQKLQNSLVTNRCYDKYFMNNPELIKQTLGK